MPVFLNDWAGGSEKDVLSDFGMPPQTLDGCNLIVASYSYEDYSGDAFVLYEKDGSLFEVNGSHCSCYGLSESDYMGGNTSQWEPEPTSVDALSLRNWPSTSPGISDAVKAYLNAKEPQT